MMTHIECWLGSFVDFRGSGPVLLRNPIFVIFKKGSGPPVPTPSGSAHAAYYRQVWLSKCGSLMDVRLYLDYKISLRSFKRSIAPQRAIIQEKSDVL